jgi:hypothetical protein
MGKGEGGKGKNGQISLVTMLCMVTKKVREKYCCFYYNYYCFQAVCLETASVENPSIYLIDASRSQGH